MKSILKKPIQIGATVFGILYFITFGLELLNTEEFTINFESFSVLTMLIFYLVGLIFSWVNEKIGSILFQIWYLCIWILSYYFWTDAGMVLILALPVLLLGIFLYQNTFKKTHKSKSKLQLKKHLLTVFMLNYGILYTTTAIPNLFMDFSKYSELPMLIFPLLFLLFIISFIFSWKNEIISGGLLIIWYIFVVFFSITSSEFMNEGPTFAFGLTLFILGIMYIKYHSVKQKLNIKGT